MEHIKPALKIKIIAGHVLSIVMGILAWSLLGYIGLALYIALIWSRHYQYKKKYLAYLHIHDNLLSITYLSRTLRPAVDRFEPGAVLMAETVRSGFIFKYPLTLNIKTNDGWSAYTILDEQTANSVLQYLDITTFPAQQQVA